MVNGINSLISLSGYSLLVYSNARDFCVLISSSDFLIVSVEFSMCSIVLSANSESFTPWEKDWGGGMGGVRKGGLDFCKGLKIHIPFND